MVNCDAESNATHCRNDVGAGGTGAKLWQSGYALPYTPNGPTVAHGSGPKATPLFHDRKIITLGISGIVAAFDAQTLQGVRQVISVTQAAVVGVAAADGRLLWQFPCTGGRSGGIMPIPYGDTLIVSATTAGVMAISPRYRNGSWLVDG